MVITSKQRKHRAERNRRKQEIQATLSRTPFNWVCRNAIHGPITLNSYRCVQCEIHGIRSVYHTSKIAKRRAVISAD